MFLGRLEFFTIVIGVLKLFHDGADILSAGLKARSAKPSVAPVGGGTQQPHRHAVDSADSGDEGGTGPRQ